LCSALQVIPRNMQTRFRALIMTTIRQSYDYCAQPFESLQETCIPSLESFELMVTMLRSGQEMLYKNQRGLIKKQNRVELPFLCTALQVIVRNMHTSHLNLWWQSYVPDKEIGMLSSPKTKVIPICRLVRWHKKKAVQTSNNFKLKNIKLSRFFTISKHTSRWASHIYLWNNNLLMVAVNDF